MGIRALIRRCDKTGDICDDAVTGPKIGPDSINDKDHDHIDPAWEQTGCESKFYVDSPGWLTRPVIFPAAFPSVPNFLLASISNTNPCMPSGLKAFVYPCNLTAAGFVMNLDVNASCAVVSAYVDVCWMVRRT